jgi:hypothetical protein
VLDRDERVAPLYFDLRAVSVVEPEIRCTIAQMTIRGGRCLSAC